MRCALCVAMLAGLLAAETRVIPLDPLSKLRLHNVTAQAMAYKGRQCVEIKDANPGKTLPDGSLFAIVDGADFAGGVIDVDLTGDALPGMPEAIRGFTGVAFRIAANTSSYEAFYLRPKNGRSEDQLQRNHSAQYISMPEFPWKRLRAESPGKYETYADLAPGEWTHVKIDVRGNTARLCVHGASQPTLIVNDLKHGRSHGALALWIGPGVVAHFANLRVTR
ncbi:MAG: hypothetical protein ABI165_16675 [Bryobacteraceae bacterium]